MRRRGNGWATVSTFLALATTLPVSRGDEPAPAARTVLTVEAFRPDEQARRLIALFEGSGAPHPAAALSAWKRANPGRNGLSKPLEAAIAALNPQTAEELRTFDRAELRLTADPAGGGARWLARAPADDGTLAAFATALALTDGAPLEPLGDATVVRLGPPGSLLAASRPGLFAVAPGRAELRSLLKPITDASTTLPPVPAGASGWRLRLDPAALASLPALDARRLAAGLAALRCQEVVGWIALDGATLRLHSRARVRPGPLSRAPIGACWFDPVPAANLLATAAIAFGPDGTGLDTAFELVDRIEKADPANAGLAPLRARLDLMVAAARVWPGRDLWANFRGLTAAIFVDDRGTPSTALIGLHTPDATAAQKIAGELLPRLAAVYARGPRAEAPADAPRPLGSAGGKTIRAEVLGSSVWVAWGDGVLEAVREAAARPERSAGPFLRTSWGEQVPQRFGAFWPAQWDRLAPRGSALAEALGDSPPVVWVGRTDGEALVDVIHWGGLKESVRRGLAALPLDPPPAEPTR